MPCAPSPEVWIVPAFVTVTLPALPPVPPAPPTFRPTSELEEEPLAKADRPSCATRPALPPPPPRLCAWMPTELSPVVWMLPVLVTPTSAPVPPVPPLPPTFRLICLV